MSTDVLSYNLQKVIRSLPGYDPFAQAGDCYFDEQAAAHALSFFPECLTFTKGEKAGKPFVLELWQKAIVANLFGWKRPDGTRRYREALIFLARKNGKTELAAGIVVYVMYCDDENRPECYSTAAEREQARLVFEAVRVMITQEPDLLDIAEIYKYAIVVWDGSYKALSAEAGSKHGFNTHLVINDEIHAQPNRDLIDVMMTSMGARSQPIAIHITTSDFQREGSICNEKHDYATKVRDNVIEDDAFLPVIYEASLDDDWTDAGVWRKANPNLGVSLSEEWLARECKRAQESPSYENTFKRMHLNIRTEQETRWLQMERWNACRAAPFDPAELEGQKCWCGLDLSSTTDLSCLAMVFDDDGLYRVLAKIWVPKDNVLIRERRDRVPYTQWIREGWITPTPGGRIDYECIRRDINELYGRYNLSEIAVDPWNAKQLLGQLDEDGLTVFEHRQGFMSMSSPTKELERVVIAGNLDHGCNPVLTWAASNVVVEEDQAGNLRPTKKKSTERIDPIVALIMALGRATMGGGGSVYDDPGKELFVL